MMTSKSFALFSSCRVVKGIKKSIICDLHRNFIHSIPASLAEILDVYQGSTIEEVKFAYSHEHDDVIDEYFLFLANEELIFFTENVECFPDLSMYWNEPYKITNAIVDIDDNIDYALAFLSQLIDSGCHTLQIRCLKAIKLQHLLVLLNKMETSHISSVEIILPFSIETSFESLKGICEKFNRVSMITVSSSPKNESYHIRGNGFGHIYYISQKIDSEKCCGQIDTKLFTINMKTFTESVNFNSCLNRKISIDTNGNVKNCPSMTKSYGNINEVNINTVIDDVNFKKVWDITKNETLVCQSCEYRHVCTDCRAYIEDPKNILSKPLKCGYDPTKGEWQDWASLPNKQFAIKHYGLSEFAP